MHAFFEKRSFSSNQPFKTTARAKPASKTKKSPVKKQVVFHPSWSKSSVTSRERQSGRPSFKPKSPFGVQKGRPYKGKGKGNTSDLKVSGRLCMCANALRHNHWAYNVMSQSFLGIAPRQTTQKNMQGSAIKSVDRELCIGHASKSFLRARFFGTDNSLLLILSS